MLDAASRASASEIVTVDSNADGSVVTGTLQTSQFDVSGKLLCQGSYTFTATKIHN